MARRRKKGTRRRRSGRRRSAPKKTPATPLAAAAGIGASGVDLLLMPDKTYAGTVADYTVKVLKGTEKPDALGRVLQSKLTTLGTYKWAAYGLGVSASKNFPILRLIGRPVDRELKKLTKGKVGL